MDREAALAIINGDIYTPDRVVKRGVLIVKEGRISFIGKQLPGRKQDYKIINARGKLVLPGFIDIHIHGGNGFDVATGEYLPKQDKWDNRISALDRAVPAVVRHHARHGTTSIVLATYAVPDQQLVNAVEAIGKYTRHGVTGGARVLGSHVEGTFLKSIEYSGAQSYQYFKKPSIPFFKRLLKVSQDTIRIVNVVPDYGKASLDLIRFLHNRSIIPGIGHASCTFNQYRAAIAAGASLHIHLGNGPTETNFKPPGRSLEAALLSDEITGELILDGYHLNPAYVMDFILAKEANVVGITDCMFVSGARKVRRFTLGTKQGEVSRDGECLNVAGKDTILFGSNLTMNRALRNLVRWLTAGTRGIYHREPVRTSFENAVRLGIGILAENPARLMDIFRWTGSLTKGKQADIVVCDKRFEVKTVMVSGEICS